MAEVLNAWMMVLYFFVLLLIIASFSVAVYYGTSKTTQANAGTAVLAPTCELDVSELIDVTNLPCCFRNGVTTSLKFDRDINPSLVLAPYPTYYLDVCVGYCGPSGYDPSTGQCVGGNTPNFNQCVELLAPKTCRGSALPIANSGPVLYYAAEAGVCDLCCPCGTQFCDPKAC